MRRFGKRIYSDKQLKTWSKDKLIEYIRIIEDNYFGALEFNERQAQNIEKLLLFGEDERSRR